MNKNNFSAAERLSATTPSIRRYFCSDIVVEADALQIFFVPCLTALLYGSVEDAVMASDFVKCNKVLGVNYDTFNLIKIDHEAAKRSFKAKGKELILLEIGKSLMI